MRTRLPWIAATLALAAGCDTPLALTQRLAGDWVGRPETAVERTIREWPTRQLDPDDPEIAAAAAEAPPTDLEAFDDVSVRLRLDESGDALLSLAGGPPLAGRWSATPGEGRRAVLELTVQRSADDPGSAERRRFDVETLREGEGFVLREQGADRRFGRLIFARPGAAETPSLAKQATTPQAETQP